MEGILYVNQHFQKSVFILLISSVILFSAGCNSSPGRGTLEETLSKNSITAQNMAQNVPTSKTTNRLRE